MIEVKQLKKRYGQLEVLKGIDLQLNAGDFVAVVGPSGAGKTTLLQLLGTLDRPDEGSIHYQGKDLAKLKPKALAKIRNQHIGFVFQFHQLLPEFSALENAMLPALITGKSKAQAEKQAKKWLEALNLGHRLEHKPSALSGGEQQRVAIARALVNEPQLILADEPSGNLDSQNAKEVHDLLAQLNAEYGFTLVVVTHNPLLAEMAHKTITMKDGKLHE